MVSNMRIKIHSLHIIYWPKDPGIANGHGLWDDAYLSVVFHLRYKDLYELYKDERWDYNFPIKK